MPSCYPDRVWQTARTIKPKRGFWRWETQSYADAWEYALPRFGRLALLCGAPRPGQLKIADLRAIPCKMTFTEWGDGKDELAIAVELLTVILDRRKFIHEMGVLADVGLHALARRYERGEDRFDDAVLADLTPLAEAHAQTIALGRQDFSIAGWLGKVTKVKGQPVLAVRTFVS